MRPGGFALLAGLAMLVAACGPLLDALQDPIATEVGDAPVDAVTPPVTTLGAVGGPVTATNGLSVTGAVSTATDAGETGASASSPAASAAAPGAPNGTGAAGAAMTGEMLTAEEQHRAEYLALESAGADAVLAGASDRTEQLGPLDAAGAQTGATLAALAARPTYRVLYRERLPAKDGAPRAAEVVVYRYDTDQVVRCMVNLETNAVETEVSDAKANAVLPPPVTPDEVREAALVARADDAVRQALAAAGLDPAGAPANGILTGTDDPTSPCAGRRCLRLFFGSLRDPFPRFAVVVDLSHLTVVDVVAMPGEGGER